MLARKLLLVVVEVEDLNSLNQEIPVIFVGKEEVWTALSPQSREIFLKHSGSLIKLGKDLKERDDKRYKSRPPAPVS